MQPAIVVENLSKQFHIGRRQSGQYRTLRDTIVEKASAPFRRLRRMFGGQAPAADAQAQETIWALKNVSFEVPHGGVVGVIGRNGAGKSTLLKILSRITEPTAGRVELRGRLGSLLEVGTGFHLELTGRENIFLNGGILGMSLREIKDKFDQIAAFAEIDTLLDTPVKRYSSGMYVRLAFAVAAYLEPEILLLDEVLSVGDMGFQKKCFGKVHELAQSGRTILLVSHNMTTIQQMCRTVVVLAGGQVAFAGPAEGGIRVYLEDMTASPEADVDLRGHRARYADRVPLLSRVRLLDSDGNPRARFRSGDGMRIELTVDPRVRMEEPQLRIEMDDGLGARILNLASWWSDSRLGPIREPSTVTCVVERLPVLPGRYFLSFYAGAGQDRHLEALAHAVAFDVEPGSFFDNGHIPCVQQGKVLVHSRWEQPAAAAEPAAAGEPIANGQGS